MRILPFTTHRARRRIGVVAAATVATLAVVLVVSPTEAAPAAPAPARSVGLAAYRIPDRLLSLDLGSRGSIGYGYPPAYGFDTADHRIQCYIAPSEDSSPFACGVVTSGRARQDGRCRTPKYFGVLGFTNTAYGGGRAGTTCDAYPIVPRQRKPGSTSATSRQINRVLPAGSTIRYLGVACTARGSGARTTMTCTESDEHHGFRASSSRITTY